MNYVAHLLGNGPSRSAFIHKPEGDIFLINHSVAGVKPVATFCADSYGAVEARSCIIVPKRLERYAIKDGYRVVGILNQPHNGLSTGHVAYDWLCERGYLEIHLWGFDSLWRESVESDSDGIKCETNWVSWRREWEKRLTVKAPTTIIHPMG